MAQLFQQYFHYFAMGLAALIVIGIVVSWVSAGLKATISGLGFVLGWGGVVVMVVFPWLVHVVGTTYAELHQPVQGLWSMPDETLRGFLGMAGTGAFFGIFTAFAAWFSSRVSTILLNVVGNISMMVWIAVHAGFQYGKGTLKFYQLYSAEIAVMATLIVVIAGVMGAWNKNPTQIERGTT